MNAPFYSAAELRRMSAERDAEQRRIIDRAAAGRRAFAQVERLAGVLDRHWDRQQQGSITMLDQLTVTLSTLTDAFDAHLGEQPKLPS